MHLEKLNKPEQLNASNSTS